MDLLAPLYLLKPIIMKKSIRLCLTDTHVNNNNLDLQESIWLQAIEVCKSKNINVIHHLGDFVTNRKAQSLAVLEHLMWIKSLLLENNISLIGITGNHDRTNLESVFAYPNIFNDKNFKIVEESYQEVVGDIEFTFLSYFPETGSYKERFNKIRVDDTKFTVLHTHIGISGGLSHKNATINKEVPSDMFGDFDLVTSGHYHNRNKVDNDVNTDIWYIGSAYAANYGEDNDKGFTIIYDDGSIEFHQTDFPKYETISVDVTEVDGKWLSSTKKSIAASGSNVRVIVTGDESELKKVKKQKFSDIGVKKLQLSVDTVDVLDVKSSTTFVSLNKETAIKEYKKFCVKQELDPDFGLEYLEN